MSKDSQVLLYAFLNGENGSVYNLIKKSHTFVAFKSKACQKI